MPGSSGCQEKRAHTETYCLDSAQVEGLARLSTAPGRQIRREPTPGCPRPTWLPHGLIEFLLSHVGAMWELPSGSPGRASAKAAGPACVPGSARFRPARRGETCLTRPWWRAGLGPGLLPNRPWDHLAQAGVGRGLAVPDKDFGPNSSAGLARPRTKLPARAEIGWLGTSRRPIRAPKKTSTVWLRLSVTWPARRRWR